VKNYDLYIMVNNPVTYELVPNRVQLIGTQPALPDYQNDRIQLQVTYTTLN